MSLIVDVIIALVGGGLVGTIVNVVTSRSRKAEGIKSYQDTINMLMDSNSVLVEERTRLIKALSDLKAQIDNDNE